MSLSKIYASFHSNLPVNKILLIMNEITSIAKKNNASKSILLAARVIGTLWLVICLFLFVGYFLEGIQRHPGVESKPPDVLGIATVIFLLIGLVGLLIAWWREGIGGFLSLFGFIIAGALVIIDPNLIFSLPFFVIILLPSILYLAYWWQSKKSDHIH
jgi:hypothetical protein